MIPHESAKFNGRPVFCFSGIDFSTNLINFFFTGSITAVTYLQRYTISCYIKSIAIAKTVGKLQNLTVFKKFEGTLAPLPGLFLDFLFYI